MVSVSWKGMRPPFEIVAICAAARDWILDGDLQAPAVPKLAAVPDLPCGLFLLTTSGMSFDYLVGSPGGYRS